MPRARPPRTLVEVAVANLLEQGVPMRKALPQAARIVSTPISLAICRADRDEEGWPSQLDYAAYWKISERKAQLEWADFRRAFPSEAGPDRLAQLMFAEYSGRLTARSAGRAMSWPIPAEFAPA